MHSSLTSSGNPVGAQLGDLREQVQALQIELMRQRLAGGKAGSPPDGGGLGLGGGGQDGAAAYLQALAGVPGGAAGAEVELLRDQLQTLQAQHDSAKKAVLSAEGNVVQLSEAYLEVAARLRGCVHRVRQVTAGRGGAQRPHGVWDSQAVARAGGGRACSAGASREGRGESGEERREEKGREGKGKKEEKRKEKEREGKEREE